MTGEIFPREELPSGTVPIEIALDDTEILAKFQSEADEVAAQNPDTITAERVAFADVVDNPFDFIGRTVSVVATVEFILNDVITLDTQQRNSFFVRAAIDTDTKKLTTLKEGTSYRFILTVVDVRVPEWWEDRGTSVWARLASRTTPVPESN